MYDPTSVIWRCTVQARSGRFCDLPAMEDVPFPICDRHAKDLFEHFGRRAIETRYVEIPAAEEIRRRNEALERMQRRAEAIEAQSQVYYLRMGDHVKIGYSRILKNRLTALHVGREVVLATEPGGPEKERARHEQFAAERRPGRGELFNPSRRLLAHIDAVRDEHGEPNITGYPRIDAA